MMRIICLVLLLFISPSLGNALPKLYFCGTEVTLPIALVNAQRDDPNAYIQWKSAQYFDHCPHSDVRGFGQRLPKENSKRTLFGPDGFGYFADDTDPAVFSSIVGGPGTTLEATTSNNDDGVSSSIPLGFGLNYYGVIINTIRISSNGFLHTTLSSSSGCCQGQPIPSPGGFLNINGVIAALWNDFAPMQGGDIYYQTSGAAPNRVFTVEYNNVRYFSTAASTTFQILLYENGNIRFIYTDLNIPNIAVRTIGIENQAGNVGIQVYFSDVLSIPYSNRAILFTHPNTLVAE